MPRLAIISSPHRLAAALFGMALSVVVQGFAAPAPAAPTKEQIAKWVAQLGDNEFGVREEATKKLWEAGQPAEASLQAAAKSEDAEVSRRAKEVLEKFRWGIYPDTPPKIVDLIGRYQTAAPGNRGQIIRELFEAGGPGCRVLVRILRKEEDVNARRDLVAQISVEMSRAVPLLLVEGNFEMLEPLLDIGIAGEVKPGILAYAAYWHLRGKDDERIAHFKALPETKQHAEISAYLYRAKGDLKAARLEAAKAEKPELEEAILYEAGEWQELAKRQAATDSEEPVERLGYRAAYHRLAGKTKEFDQAIADLKKLADNVTGKDDPTLFAVVKALFVNDRPADALELLGKAKLDQKTVEVLCSQLKFRDAMAVVDKAREANADDLPVLELLIARHLHNLGEKEKALPIFARYAEQIKPGKDNAWFENLVDSEFRAGLKDQAFEHAGKVLGISNDAGWVQRLFAKLFPEKSQNPEAWYGFLRRRNATREPGPILKQVRDIHEGKVPPKEMAELIEAWVDVLERRLKVNRTNVPLVEVDRAANAIADAAIGVNLEALAITSLKKLDSVGALTRVGDLLAAKKKWAEAAENYRLAWERDRHQALTLFLYGNALVQSGKEVEGKKKMEQAHWLPLGDEAARSALGTALSERGFAEASKRENELLLRLSQPASYYWGEGLRKTTPEAMTAKDYLRVAEGHERAMLRVLRTYVSFMQSGAYVAVPAMVHRQRATGLVMIGKFDDAKREAALAFAAMPGDVDLAIQLVPELEKRDRKKDAAELYAQSLAVYEKLCADFPKCSWAHNSAAWLAACCRRDLDNALQHGLKGVELAPKSAGHLDTLAEVYFQRGEKDKAIETQKKAIALDPKKPYYRKQLKRIEAGDPAAERPAEGDEE